MRFVASVSLLAVGLLGLSISAFAAGGNHEVIIAEMENLRNSLVIGDPGRTEVTLRLADFLFDYSLELGRTLDLNDAQRSKLSQARRRAIELYRDAKPAPAALAKVKFQLARLYTDEGKPELAEPLWVELVHQHEQPLLRREASVRLAESYEQAGKADLSEKYYVQSIELCAGTDLCSYARHRRAWLYYRRGDMGRASSEIKAALWDSRGQIREEALADAILFHSHLPGDGSDVLRWFEEMSLKLGRPDLVGELAKAYFASGNRVARTHVLEYLSSKRDSVLDRVQLLEEYFAARNWDRFSESLSRLKSFASAGPEAEGILKRIAVQLDAERVATPERAPHFKDLALTYLRLFPESSIRAQMQDGWLAAEKDPGAKQDQLASWIQDAVTKTDSATELKLRQARAAVAQERKDFQNVASEMAALSSRTKDSQKSREYSYHQARALYSAKDNASAYALFVKLADPQSFSASKPDSWAIQSENLALDILNQEKRYDELVTQAELWTRNPSIQSNPSLKDELADLQKILEQARFEKASVVGGAEALASFLNFCSEKKFTPKSCENARVLAVQLKDQAALIRVLEIENKEAELASELEAAGYFARAAKLKEKLNPKASIVDLCLFALFYELEGVTSERDRLLRAAWAQARGRKSLSATEADVLLVSIKGTSLYSADLLQSAAWDTERRLQIAHDLEKSGQGNANTKKLLLGSKISQGDAWSKLVLEEIRRADRAQGSIGFYGKKGQQLFQKRLKALDGLVALANSYLNGADHGTRVRILSLLERSYSKISDEILASPLPPSLSEEAKASIVASLSEMARPFSEKGLEWKGLASEQLAKIENPEERTRIESSLEGSQDQIQVTQAAPRNCVDDSIRRGLEELHRNPSDMNVLDGLQAAAEHSGCTRVASYYKGRILQLKEIQK